LLAADGWVDDALYRFERPGAEGEGVTLWVTRWNDERGADDFVYGIERALGGRFPGTTPQEEGATRVWRAGERVFRIERRGVEIRIRVAPTPVDPTLGTDARQVDG